MIIMNLKRSQLISKFQKNVWNRPILSKLIVPKHIGVGSCMSPVKAHPKRNATDHTNIIVIKSIDISSGTFALQQMVGLADIDSGESK